MKIEYKDELFDKESLENTPNRIKNFMEEWSSDKDFRFTVFPNKKQYDQMIILKCEFDSLCSHHMLPFRGMAYVGYIPNGKICGISKLARVVDKFAHKPQIQESLVEEIADFLVKKLEPKGVMVVMKAQHQCMSIRGVRKVNSEMVTSAVRGNFKNIDTRTEFLELIKLK